MDKTYDAIIIGSGQGGKPLAIELAKRGKKTLLVEKEYIGGTCINWGCTPTKTMVASAKAAYEARREELFGVTAGQHRVDMAAVKRRKKEIVESFREGSLKGIRNTKGLDLVFGVAGFLDANRLKIEEHSGQTHHVAAQWIIINTGGRPRIPPIDGIGTVPILTSTTIMDLEEVPEHLLVIGGGYISLEFSQMFRRFGSRVTILERNNRILKREDPDVSEEMRKIFSEEDIEILFNTPTNSIAADREGNVVINGTIQGTHLLLAAGRSPNIEELQLEAAGIEKNSRGYIQVNEILQTSQKHIYAIGDVNGGPEFTHISYDDYRILRDNLLNHGSRTTKGRLVPYTIYTDPQLGRVGMTEEEAKRLGVPHKVTKLPMTYVARAIETGEMRGFMKAVVHAETQQILGCAVLGAEGGEIMSMIEIAMMSKLPYSALGEAIFAHPTFAEALNNLFAKI